MTREEILSEFDKLDREGGYPEGYDREGFVQKLHFENNPDPLIGDECVCRACRMEELSKNARSNPPEQVQPGASAGVLSQGC